MKEQRLEELFNRFMQGSLPDAEETELWQLWLDTTLETRRVQLLDAVYDRLPEDMDMSHSEADRIFREIVNTKSPVHQVRRQPHIPAWRRIAVAASIILIVGAGGWIVLHNSKGKKSEIARVPETQDIKPPVNNHARITLANRQTVYLDSAVNGSVAMQGHVQLVKQADGQIVYKGTAKEIVYNTLTNPRGSKVIEMRLSDGSRIWLNAGSSVTYPVAFVGKNRKVEIDGEAYFEVSPDASMPFIVTKGIMEIQVLGTHFNVNAYEDEPDIKVTLLEGAVKVGNSVATVNMHPGEQARIAPHLPPRTANDVNLEQVMAWKNGLFSFEGADLPMVMRQLARWYDIEIKYDRMVPHRAFKGEITRDLTLTQLMNGLRAIGIKFRIEGRTMIVIQG